MRLDDTKKQHRFSLPFHVSRKLDISKTKYWLIKVGGILSAFLIAGILCTIFKPNTFGEFYKQMFLGVVNPAIPARTMEFLFNFGLYILVALGLSLAFKMKFWNIGGEGQILVGALACAGIVKFLAMTAMPDALIIIISLLGSIAAGILWGVIPAIFKALFNTNETLFTLMMNYIAVGLIAIFINIWNPGGSQQFGTLTRGVLPKLFGVDYLFALIFVVVVAILIIVYIKKTKHGYEIAVVGESVNTARYVGINVKKVIIRTMILSGAICGLVGFLLVSGNSISSLNKDIAGGRGFTGVLIAWLASFKPGQIILYSGLTAFFSRGSYWAASNIGIEKDYFSPIITGIFFLAVIASEFFVNYKVMMKQPLGEYFKGLFKRNKKNGQEEVLEVATDPIAVTGYSNEEPVEAKEEPVEKEELKEDAKSTTEKAKKSSKSNKKPAKVENNTKKASGETTKKKAPNKKPTTKKKTNSKEGK